MSKLHSQLALFGAIDQEVSAAKKRLKDGADGDDAAAASDLIDMVGKFLPGTTGFGQHGWYAELAKFLNRPPVLCGRSRVVFPDLNRALAELRGAEKEQNDRDPVLARAVYAAVILKKIYSATGRGGTEEDTDAFSIVGPSLKSWTSENEAEAAVALERVVPDINNRQTWLSYAAEAVGAQFAERSMSCFGALKKVNGQYCAFVTTDATDDDLTVADIAKIVEPINWHECCTFFCHMTAQTDPHDQNGATRVSERISAECKEYFLDTALVFWKAKQADGSIYINYDIDSTRDNDTGLVEVDSGYIWITPIPGQVTGVRVRTSKLERVSGLSPTATAALACLLGWGSQAHEMLAGTARRYMQNPVPPPTFQPFRRSPYDAKTYTDA
ncbi:hypothetical protein [Mycobacterium sp. URHB0044]|jgi:hypothetical protein|uniref:hypothetical protein n=1 Tax=Mycobacterium sp. URHB0044 TaxID=1380386 RepID=UPI00048C4D95|nr:hypothetical protein [Mycobacterium sp. URHB0044]